MHKKSDDITNMIHFNEGREWLKRDGDAGGATGGAEKDEMNLLLSQGK